MRTHVNAHATQVASPSVSTPPRRSTEDTEKEPRWLHRFCLSLACDVLGLGPPNGHRQNRTAYQKRMGQPEFGANANRIEWARWSA